MSASLRWTIAEIGRILYTHALDPAPVAVALSVAPAMFDGCDGDDVHADAGPAVNERGAALVLNILVRVETRCCGDTVAIAAALMRPLEFLGGSSLAEGLAAGPDLTGLRALREAAGTMPVPRIRMWRAADRYS